MRKGPMKIRQHRGEALDILAGQFAQILSSIVMQEYCFRATPGNLTDLAFMIGEQLRSWQSCGNLEELIRVGRILVLQLPTLYGRGLNGAKIDQFFQAGVDTWYPPPQAAFNRSA